MANFELISFPSDAELAQAAAKAWLEEFDTQSGSGRPFCVALSGGRIAKIFFGAVAAQAHGRTGPMANVHFFWGDERCLPPDDPESNFRVARELLFVPLRIAGDKIHRIRGEAPVEFAVTEAEAELCRLAPLNGDGQPVLDLVLLGMDEE